MKVIRKKKTASAKVEAVNKNITLTEDTLPVLSAANIQAMFNSPDFKTIPTESEVEGYFSKAGSEDTLESLQEIDDTSINSCVENYLKTVYSSVQAFKLYECRLKNNKLLVEGYISFKNGKTKRTIFEFMPDGKNMLRGSNKGIAEDVSFILAYQQNQNTLLAECLKYSYSSKIPLTEGLSKYN